MSSRSTRTRRRTQTIVGLAAVAGLLGATPAMSAIPGSTAVQAATASTVSVPSNVTLLKTLTSKLGVHSWYQQTLGGYPVVGGLYAQHTTTVGADSGQTTVWDGRVPAGALVSGDATVSSAAAIAAAVAYTKGTALTYVAPSLWVLPGAQSHLVWSVSSVTSAAAGDSVTAAHLTYVDAQTGKVLKDVIESQMDTAPDAKYVTGKAKTFDPNPVVKLQDEDLTDQNDSNAAVPAKGYSTRDLGHLDTSHTLVGEWAKIVNDDIASSKSNKYMYKRADDRFEQVMDYYALDTEESYYQELGFKNVNNEAQKIEADAMADDNSWYIPSQDLIQTGTGGVDDAEDPEVVWHEDGHATQDAQVPGWGASEEAGAMGEGYGDYIAVTMSQKYAKETKLTPYSCVMDWDSTSYTAGPQHCLRTTVTDKMYPEDLDGEVHDDGEIWSHALWNMNLALGRDKATTAIVEATFSMNPSINMPDAAAQIVKTTKDLYGASASAKAKAAFVDRGILKK